MIFHPDALLLALWSILCVWVGSHMGRKAAPGPGERPFEAKKEAYSFVDEPGFLEDERLKESDDGYRSINQGKVERRGDE